MSKRYNALAGARPVFESTSIQPLNRKARVTGKRITAGGNHALRTLNYESAARKGNVQNMTDQQACECLPTGIPSMQTIEDQANAYLYGGTQAGATRYARNWQDNRKNYCASCHVLMPASRKCPECNSGSN